MPGIALLPALRNEGVPSYLPARKVLLAVLDGVLAQVLFDVALLLLAQECGRAGSPKELEKLVLGRVCRDEQRGDE